MIARALTIAGSDSGGGAGIQQDLKTFQALGVWGMTAITAVTVQNTLGVQGWQRINPEIVAAQITAVAEDIGVDAAKTGMLPDVAIITAVARAVRDARIEQLVVDPVMVATSGDALIDDDAVDALVSEILPLAGCVTPNAREAERLTGLPVRTPDEQRAAARAIRAMGARAALVKGGHTGGAEAIDVLVDADDQEHELVAPWIDTTNTHGTGCMLSAAIVAGLAQGMDLVEAARRAKRFVTRGIEHALPLGGGAGPVDPMA